ncbi:MAG: hypothetical protein U0800_14025 [Isosphaeraceae bacterium]
MRLWTAALGAIAAATIPTASFGQFAGRPTPTPTPVPAPAPMPALPNPNMPDPGRVAAVVEILDEELPTLGPIREMVNLPTAVIAARRYAPRPVQLL